MSTKRIEYKNGDIVGNFKFIKDDGIHIKAGGSKARKAIFMCECGNEISKPIYIIKSKRIKSCGCKREELLQQARTHHGLSKHPLMKRWDAMIGRCYRSNVKYYYNYGGRGITVCEEWKNNFKSFYDWSIANGYDDGLTIDRIDNDGNYEPSNCRWVTRTVQSRNTRKLFSSNTSGYRGAIFMKKNKKWCSKITINDKSVHIGVFNSAQEAGIAYDKYVIDNNLEHTKNFG